MNKKIIVASAAIICFVLAPVLIAAEGVPGEWEFKQNIEARRSSATMTITTNAEGRFEGKWSSQWGESQLSDISFANDRLSFVQTSKWQDQEFKTTYDAAVEGGKLTGKGKGQWGDFTFEGALQGEAESKTCKICGTWQMNVTIPAREIVEKLVITQNKDGSLAGKWTAERGENTISNMKFEAGKLTFTRTSKMGERQWQSQFEGTVAGDQIKGAFSGEWGNREANATRVGVPKVEEGKKPDEAGKEKSKESGSEEKPDDKDLPT